MMHNPHNNSSARAQAQHEAASNHQGWKWLFMANPGSTEERHSLCQQKGWTLGLLTNPL